jgi:oligopeptide transport system ATP-binding protein
MSNLSKKEAKEVLVEVKQLKKYFPIRRGVFQSHVGDVQAVDGVSFEIYKGETLGLVGESGCGKSTTGRAILQLLKPTSGEVVFGGVDLVKMSSRDLQLSRRNLQIIFQDPYASLNPRMSVAQSVIEPLQIHGIGTAESRKERVKELLELVGLNPDFGSRYPHEFSGGQRQRIGIARALSTNPEFIVADEPISALDVSIQAQVVNLMADLKEELGLTYLFIAHDLSMVRYISDRVAVMYLGRIVEIGDVDTVYDKSLHPYTRALISAIPIPDPDREMQRQQIILEGDVPNPANPPSGCRFHTRCPIAIDICKHDDPQPHNYAAPGESPHWVACHRANEIQAGKI